MRNQNSIYNSHTLPVCSNEKTIIFHRGLKPPYAYDDLRSRSVSQFGAGGWLIKVSQPEPALNISFPFAIYFIIDQLNNAD